MNFYISYPYMVRFMPKNAVPISTMMYDPKWFHDFKGQNYHFKDQRGVWNGLRAEPLCPKAVHVIGEQMCGKDCKQELPCLFMKEYYKYLKTLDFLDIIVRASLLAKKAVAPEDGEPFVVFLVNEPPYVKCAERPCLMKWFEEEGTPDERLREWQPDLC